MEASTELVTMAQVEDVLLHGGDLAVVTEDEVQADMIRRILAAGNLGEAFADFRATAARDIEGRLVEVRGVAWMRSAFEEGPKVYCLLQVVDVETGELATVSMGGRTLMAAFLWAQRQEAMPFRGVFERERSRTNTERQFWTFKLT